MHVVVSFSRVVLQHCIISLVIVCFGSVVVPAVGLHFVLARPLFVLYSMHLIPLLIPFVIVLRHRPATNG